MLDGLMLFLSDRMTWVGVAIVAVLIGWRRRQEIHRLVALCLFVGASLGITDLFSYQVLKPTFERLRPCYQFADEVRLVQERCGSDYGFPSNHAANGMAAATAIAFFTRSRVLSGLAVVLAILVGFSRVYLGVHFPGDVLAGFATGAVTACLLWWSVGQVPRLRRWRGMTPPPS